MLRKQAFVVTYRTMSDKSNAIWVDGAWVVNAINADVAVQMVGREFMNDKHVARWNITKVERKK